MKTVAKCKSGGQILLIPREDIVPNPRQPRKCFDIDALEGLAESIRQNGIIQPLNVRLREDGKYEIIAGERRLRAAKLVGLSKLPCILMEANDEKSAVYALLENLQRRDLGFFEEALGIERLLLIYGMNRETAAKRLGLTQQEIAAKLELLRIPEEIRAELLRLDLTEAHARALLTLDTPAQMQAALRDFAAQRQSVVLTEESIYRPEPTQKTVVKAFRDIRLFVNTLDHAVDTMREAGINADAEKRETEVYIQYTVRIPKNRV